MSIRCGKNGKFSVSMPLMFISSCLMIIMAYSIVFLTPIFMDKKTTFIPCIICIILGFSCLLISKISLFRKSNFFSFGAKIFIGNFRKLYFCGYALIVMGLLLLCLSYKIHYLNYTFNSFDCCNFDEGAAVDRGKPREWNLSNSYPVLLFKIECQKIVN